MNVKEANINFTTLEEQHQSTYPSSRTAAGLRLDQDRQSKALATSVIDMLSPSPLKPSVPSSSLLRFLRSQTDYFTANPSSLASSSPCLRSSPSSSRARRPSQHCSSRGAFSTLRDTSSSWTHLDPAPCRATVEASCFWTLPSRGDRGSLITLGSGRLLRLSGLPPFRCSGARALSTKGRPLLRRLFDFKKNKAAEAAKANRTSGPVLIDDGTETSFNIGRGLVSKATNELRLRCTEFDSNGNVTLVNGEFRKSELIAKYGLLPRDLRKVDSSTLPHILVRPSAILINLLHLKVLIKADRVLVFDAYGSTDSYMQSLFVYDLEGKLRQKQALSAGALPYEFRALEAVLISVTAGLEEEFNGVRDPVVRVLRALEEDIDRDKLRHLLIYSKKLGTFEQKARLVRDAIDDLLEADDDLASMYLSERAGGIQREETDHQEVEMLLESYHKVCDEIVQASGNLVTGIRNTEEVVKAILDANRNSLMLLDLKFSIGTLGLATGTLVAGLYGMNLENFIEETNYGFGGVSFTCFAITAIVCYYGLAKLRKLQRVRMWGESGVGGAPIAPLTAGRGGAASGHRTNWRADSIEPVWGSYPGENRTERMKRLRDGAAAAAAKSAASDATATRATDIKNRMEHSEHSKHNGGQ